MSEKLIVGNWKMNGNIRSIQALLADLQQPAAISHSNIAICAPYPYLPICAAALEGSGIAVGAQNMSEHQAGAYTGEVSAAMLKDWGCRFVLIGHSERRSYFGEDDALIARKAKHAIEAGLTPIVCVGETWTQREQNLTAAILTGQTRAVADQLTTEQLAHLVIAYEPVWAIGTGACATPETAQEAHAQIRRCLHAYNPTAAARIPLLYGGSMKPDNAADLLAMPDIDGGLIGGASLHAADFLAIVQSAIN